MTDSPLMTAWLVFCAVAGFLFAVALLWLAHATNPDSEWPIILIPARESEEDLLESWDLQDQLEEAEEDDDG